MAILPLPPCGNIEIGMIKMPGKVTLPGCCTGIIKPTETVTLVLIVLCTKENVCI